tara:strand:- start:34 stop:633 length:600 start_codon:yes stop_codon:yes gene_type:complete
MLDHKFKKLTKKNIVIFLAHIFEKCGDEEYLGEPVTMAQHMLQGATLAEQQGFSDTVIVAALLHDIGHFTSEFGTFSMSDKTDKYHEDAGARVLEAFFPSIVTDCVRYHVAAKRYLCATSPDYFNKLSKASVHSLNLQGGPMSETEIKKFRTNPNLDQIIQVRYLDDAGKDPDMNTPDFWYFVPILKRVIKKYHNDLKN